MLRDRVDLVSKTQPEILDLREKLLEIGGAELVAIPPKIGLDPLIFLLAKGGELMPHPVRMRKRDRVNAMRTSRSWYMRKGSLPWQRAMPYLRTVFGVAIPGD